MTQEYLIALVDQLRSYPAETEWLEFKRNHVAPEEIGEYISALANAACIGNQLRAYLVFGIDNETHKVLGTTFDPYTAKAKGNQDLLPWISSLLQPNPGIEVLMADHPDGRVVMLELGSARDRPVLFSGRGYVRVGSSKTDIAKHPEKERTIWLRGSDWSAEACDKAGIEDLDPDAIALAREQFCIKHPSQSVELDAWDDLTFLNKARLLKRGAVTNTAILLLGRPESSTLLSPAVSKLSWILKDAENRELDYEHFGTPFLPLGDRLLGRIRNLMVRALPSGTLFPLELTQYDPWVLREALHNAIAHQDYRRHARIVVVEFPDRVMLTNAGEFLPGSVETVIEQDAPQLLYRNPFLTDAMVELNMIDTQGGGIKRMFETQRRRSFPLPDYHLETSTQVDVVISGRILDERYTRLLMEQPDISLPQVILLDRIQKGLRIDREDFNHLKAGGLVEGRYPAVMVSSGVAKVTGQKAKHIRDRGLDKKYYLDLVKALIREHQPITRTEVDTLLLDKLPEVLNDEQRRTKIHNLLNELVREGKIVNRGNKSQPAWFVLDKED